MHKTILTIILLLLCATTFAQHYFILNSRFNNQTILVNGQTYQITNSDQKIPTSFPSLDTITFLYNQSHPVVFLSNFKPKRKYTLTVACCGSLDVVPYAQYVADSNSFAQKKKQTSKILIRKNQPLS